ncbi:hypothetical protein PQO01_17945 [Lentisphaera marina]|uniref:hypothetical protein n=1 Tax=Lentisphaera marina TaxID=1111041 RepID=UPI0023657382|nr:hypothetical protein [Lentisphaera marina]MDD7986837.1 hypothetical protein [Lentisphaera marina]
MKKLFTLVLFLALHLCAVEATTVISLSDLKANQMKYSGKRVVTSGKLFFTDKRISTRSKIYLKDTARFGKTYLLQLKPEELKNPSLVNGKQVTVEVLVYGNSSTLRSCIFTSLDKVNAQAGATTPEMDFMTFAEELDNIHLCREKYKGKTLNLTGYYPLNNTYSGYYSSSSGGSNYTYFRVKDASFYIYYADETLKDFASLQPGDKINIRAKLSDESAKLDVDTLKVLEKFEERKAMKVDLGRVVEAYKRDIIKADEKYKNQKFAFRDEIYSISLDEDGEARITIRRNYEYIYCRFSKEATRKLNRYSKGDKIRLEAFHRGGNLNYLYNCQVQ